MQRDLLTGLQAVGGAVLTRVTAVDGLAEARLALISAIRAAAPVMLGKGPRDERGGRRGPVPASF